MASRFLFVANANSNAVKSFTYSATGFLIAANNGVVDSGGRSPQALAVDESASLLFVANSGTNSLQIISYDSAAALTQQGSSVDCGGRTPIGLTFIP